MTAPSSPASAPDPSRRVCARVRLRRGLDLPLDGAPDESRVEPAPPVASVAVLGDDAPGIRPDLRVAPGERVRAGQTLFVDRRRPAVRFAAPGAGVVDAVVRGARRRLEAVVIRLDEGDGEVEAFEPVAPGHVASLPRGTVEERMLASGLWTALRTRPFGRIPDPGSVPHAVFVTALESEPLAPRAEGILAERGEAFAAGVAALSRFGDGRVFVCTRPDVALPLPDVERVVQAEFEGPHPAGLPGTHVHRLAPVGPGRTVWHVGYPDVIALGGLLLSGRAERDRVVALTGPAMTRPRLVRTRLGASTEDLVRGGLRYEACRVLSGSVLSGRRAVGWGAYLGRLHTQVCALPEGGHGARSRGWIVPGRGGRARRVLALLDAFGGRRGAGSGAHTTSLGGRRGAFLPLERLDRLLPLDVPAAPLLRALLVGDAEQAQALGCLELSEEDLALASFLCPGKIDYGPLLRAVLDEIEGQGT